MIFIRVAGVLGRSIVVLCYVHLGCIKIRIYQAVFSVYPNLLLFIVPPPPLADAENAFKVRLSIRSALGDKAVSGTPAGSFQILFF